MRVQSLFQEGFAEDRCQDELDLRKHQVRQNTEMVSSKTLAGGRERVQKSRYGSVVMAAPHVI